MQELLYRSANAALPSFANRSDDVVLSTGVRIVEIGQYTVAPLASRIMGALGADVIKVELPVG